MDASSTRTRRGGWAEILAVLAVLLGMVAGLSTLGASPAFADGFQGTASSDADHETCDEAGFPEANKTNTPQVGDGSSGVWGEVLKTAEQAATVTINEGYTVDICVKTGAAVTVYSGASCDYGAADDGVACVIEYDSSGAGGGVSHVSWDNAVLTEETCEDFTGSQVPAECFVPVSLQKVDGDAAALEGATFELRDGDNVVGSCTSLADGSCSIGLVEPGTYTLVETVVPDGYNGASDLPKQVEVTYAATGDDVTPIGLGTYVNTPQTCVDTEDCPVPVTLQKVDENEEPLAGASFLLDGDTDYTCTSDGDGLCDFGDVAVGDYTLSETAAPAGYEQLVLTAEQQAVSVAFGVEPIELGPFVNTPIPTPPTPAISLVKAPVVGAGSDLLAADPNPLLNFSSSDAGPKTAIYSYLITNTGDEPLVNLALVDDRIGAADLDLSDCPEVLDVDDSCTATGSEDFTLADAQSDEDGLITNTGTVSADGQESGTTVDSTDPATIALGIVFSEVNEKPDPDPAVDGPGPDVDADVDEDPAPLVLAETEELPATGLDAQGLLPLSVLLMAIGAAILWLDRPWLHAL